MMSVASKLTAPFRLTTNGFGAGALPVRKPLHLHHDSQGVLLLMHQREDEDRQQQLHEPLEEQGAQQAAEVQL